MATITDSMRFTVYINRQQKQTLKIVRDNRINVIITREIRNKVKL